MKKLCKRFFYRQSKQRLKDMNKKGNSIDRKNVECYYKSGGETNKIMHIAQTRRKILKKKEKQWLSIALSAAMVVTGYSSNRDWNDRSGGIRRSTSLREKRRSYDRK